jgi:HSP20 family protein
MHRLSDEMDRLFEALALPPLAALGTARGRRTGSNGQGTPEGATTTPALWIPPIEVQQRDGQLVVRADLPGLKPEEIEISVDDGLLTIRGERQQEAREEGEGFVRTERTYGAFYRALPLPEGADAERIAANVKDGVLEITVPVTERQRGRRVQVTSGTTSSEATSSGTTS